MQQDLAEEIDSRTQHIFDGLSNAVYRAAKSQGQDEYNEAVDLVFSILDGLEQVLNDQAVLFGDDLTLADIWLFATFVRFDTVYATHFRCTQKRLIDDPDLWRLNRHIFQVRGIRQTVDRQGHAHSRDGRDVADGAYPGVEGFHGGSWTRTGQSDTG
ncbi:MAG: glutathione S-transferase C-terminal domain-containing protein [Pseudomonadota bacterium]